VPSHQRLWLAGGWLLVGLVIYLSLIPHPPEPKYFPSADKLGHVFAYCGLSLWFCQLYRTVASRMTTISALIGLGAGLEFIQGWMGYRYFEVWDMAANTAGVMMGFLLVHTRLGRLFVLIEVKLRQVV